VLLRTIFNPVTWTRPEVLLKKLNLSHLRIFLQIAPEFHVSKLNIFV